jgi:hypothetical protein
MWVKASSFLSIVPNCKSTQRHYSPGRPPPPSRYLLLYPVQPGPDGHRLDVAHPVDPRQVAAGLPQRLVQPPLQLLQQARVAAVGLRRTVAYLDPHHHVEVSLAVLLDDVPHVVRLPRLLELPPRHEVLDLADGPDGVLVGLGQPATEEIECEPGGRGALTGSPAGARRPGRRCRRWPPR